MRANRRRKVLTKWSRAGIFQEAVAEYPEIRAAHGSAPDIAGKHLTNPTVFLCAAFISVNFDTIS